MEVSTICGSFIYGEGQEELVNRGRYKAKKEKKRKKRQEKKARKNVRFILWQNKTNDSKYAYQWSAPVFEQKILTMHLIKEKLLFMEVSIICSSFIYSERHEERVSGVGGGEGGRVQKCILKYFSLVSEEKMEAVTIPIKKKHF